jgi:hypothetical protein
MDRIIHPETLVRSPPRLKSVWSENAPSPAFLVAIFPKRNGQDCGRQARQEEQTPR